MYRVQTEIQCYCWYRFLTVETPNQMYKTRRTQKTMQGEGFATLALKTKELNTAIYSPFHKVPITSLSIIDM